ncbi:MAG: LysM peptidoglycan-binding domain-containing protein, partial [Polyangiales bacterium]
ASMYSVKVPLGKGAQATQALAKLRRDQAPLERYVVRFGETLEQIAIARKTTKAKLVELNGIGKDEIVRGGTVLLVPPASGIGTGSGTGTGTATGSGSGSAIAVGEPIKVLVPSVTFAYPDRQRVFYRVVVGDTPRDIAAAFAVSIDDLRTWNSIEPTARLQEGMTLQVFAPKGADLSKVVAMKEGDVKIVAIGSDDFYAIEEAAKGRKRTTIYATGGETLEKIGKKYELTPGQMEKINRRPRTDVLAKGEAVIVYVKGAVATPGAPLPPDPALANDLPAKPAGEEPTETPDLPEKPN